MIEAAARIFLMPPSSFLFLILAGLVLRRWWPRTGRAIGIASAACLLLLSTGIGAMLLVNPLERLTAPLPEGQTAGAQAIVVLAAGSVEGAPEYGADMPDHVALVRLTYAAHLQRKTGLPLLVSGGNADPERQVAAKAIVMARVLGEEFKTPVRWIEDKSDTTAANAELSARILKSAGIRRVLLVTHAMHMERARLSFARYGIEVVQAPTMFYSTRNWSAWLLLPSASALYRSFYASHEWVGLIWYKLHTLRA